LSFFFRGALIVDPILHKLDLLIGMTANRSRSSGLSISFKKSNTFISSLSLRMGLASANGLHARTNCDLTQALGGSSLPIAIESHISVDSPLAPGETLLLCSDGLTDMVSEQIIHSTLKAAKTPLQAARKLAASAFSAGGRDNISLIVACRSDTYAL
jgi:serine/threonine protein phosphatase PrpC